MAMALYQLTDAYKQLIDMLDTAEDIETIRDTLDSVEETFDAKVESIVKLIKEKEAEKAAVDEEVHRLRDRSMRIAKKIEWLKSYVQTEMEKIGREKVKSPLFSISLAFNPPSVNVVNESEIPEEFIKVKEIRDVDKVAILERAKQGELVPGVEIVQRKSLRIR